ncbi:MAG: RagB/SusD family nutrient uptake outer membrane protein [Rikenellaceae bacterium]
MKLNIKKYIMVAFAALATLSSCNDYLTEENPNYTTTENFWQDLIDTQSGLNAAYAVLRTCDLLAIREEAWRSDMGWPGYGRPLPSSNAEGWSWYTHTYSNSTSTISDKWDALYRGVWRSNQVIDALYELEEGLDEDDLDTWTYQMAQARFLRGVYYFYLYSSFNEGSVILKETSTDIYGVYEGLSPADDILAFFRDDLQYAYENLPYENPTGESFEGLPAKGAATTLLGTSYLYEGAFDYANKYFEELVTDTQYPYELETDLDKMFTMAGEQNSESIFEITYTTDERTDISTWNDNVMTNPLGTYSTSTGGFLAPAWIVVAYAAEELDTNYEGNYFEDPANDGALTLRPVSLRASSMITMVIDDASTYYIDGNSTSNSKYGYTGWGFGMYKKYTNHDLFTSEPSSTSGKNVTINRLSDVYLMYAECQLEMGNIENALKYINRIRARWGLVLLGESATGEYAERTYNEVVYDYDTLTAQLRDVERPLELSVEGHQLRWQDLRRWGYLEDDNNNIFYRRSQEEYWAARPTNDLGITLHTLEGAVLSTGYAVNRTFLVLYDYDNSSHTSTTGLTYKLDYEYDNSILNYRKDNNLFYPIPSTETMNNPAI